MTSKIYGYLLALFAGALGFIGLVTFGFGLFYSFNNDPRDLAITAVSLAAWGGCITLICLAKAVLSKK